MSDRYLHLEKCVPTVDEVKEPSRELVEGLVKIRSDKGYALVRLALYIYPREREKEKEQHSQKESCTENKVRKVIGFFFARSTSHASTVHLCIYRREKRERERERERDAPHPRV